VLVSKSTDGGLTWGAPTTVGTPGHNESLDKDSITTDPTDARFAYVTWVQFHADRGTTMFSRTTDGGQTWEPARPISDPGGNNINQAHQVVVLPDGTLVNFFSQFLKTSNAGGVSHFDFKLYLIRSSDRGQTWLPGNTPIHVADILPLDDTQTIPVPNPDGGVPIGALNWVFDVAVDPANGNLYAVWEDARFSNFQYNSIAFAMSTDGGFTWSAPIQINQTPDNIPVGNRQAFIPSVAVAADGTVAVTYYDFRNNTTDPGVPTDYWMVHAHSNTDLTNPANWTSENRLTRSSFDMEQAFIPPDGRHFVGDYMGLAAAGNNFAALWAMPHSNPDGTIDRDSIFFREAMSDESHSELQAFDHQFRADTTAIPGGATLDTRFGSMVKSVESASTKLNAANVDRLFAAVGGAKSKATAPSLANLTETDALRLEPGRWLGIAERDELTAKL
jgi:hypothetical protein